MFRGCEVFGRINDERTLFLRNVSVRGGSSTVRSVKFIVGVLLAACVFTGVQGTRAGLSAANIGNGWDAPAVQQTVCIVSGATLTWGFKESFRSYLTSSIANGKWEVTDGATYATPNFAWPNATGLYNADTAAGTLSFVGQIEFTGHGGILDTTVANPRVRFDESTIAQLDLDVAGTTQQGHPIREKAVEFVELDLAAATITRSSGTVTVERAPARLTAPGARAFGTYDPGEKFDPVSLQFTVTPACAKEFIANERSAEGRPGRIIFVISIAAAFVLIIGTVTFVLLRRRRVRGRAS
jgi:large repetitive protein